MASQANNKKINLPVTVPSTVNYQTKPATGNKSGTHSFCTEASASSSKIAPSDGKLDLLLNLVVFERE